jgi:hypothetical protein
MEQKIYNRDNIHNKKKNRCRLNENEKRILFSLFANKTHLQLANLYYGEGYTLEKCAEIMCYSKRQVERIKSEIDKIALYSLLTMVSKSNSDLKLLEIKKILMGGE